MGQYAVCGQYPGAVPAGATVSLQCSGTNLPPSRYVIVQFPITAAMNFCELDVCASGMLTVYLISFSTFCIWFAYFKHAARFLPASTLISLLFSAFHRLRPSSRKAMYS